MRFTFAILSLFITATCYAALDPECEREIRANAPELIERSEQARKDMQDEVQRAADQRQFNTFGLMFVGINPMAQALKFERSVRDLMIHRPLSVSQERILTKMCKHNFEFTAVNLDQ